jgi:hypothetical protein
MDTEILMTHPVVAYFGLNATKAALHYQVMKRNPTLDTADQLEAELLETVLHDHDTFFQWVEDFMEGKFV